jgi:PAS domain-containing protein
VTTQTVILGGSTLAFAVVAVALFVIGRDFAGSRRAQAALREAHDELELRVTKRTAELEQRRGELEVILDTVPALIFFKDLQHRLVRVNLEYARVLNKAREEIVGLTISSWVFRMRKGISGTTKRSSPPASRSGRSLSPWQRRRVPAGCRPTKFHSAMPTAESSA